MTEIRKVPLKEVLMGKLEHGGDLLEQLNRICGEQKITLGRVEAMGAVKEARLGFYNQRKREYEFTNIYKPLEITSLVGNVSLKEGQPFVHAHITLADENNQVFGGHLMEGTIVFACEFIIEAFDGPPLERGFDETTGLPLWDMVTKRRK